MYSSEKTHGEHMEAHHCPYTVLAWYQWTACLLLLLLR
jgi:hypothetical protein